MRGGSKHLAALPLVLLFGLPLIASLLYALISLFDREGWAALFGHPQIWPALFLSLFTGLSAAVLSLGLALIIVVGLYGSTRWPRLSRRVGSMLAVPHLAMALGIAFLIMPSGLIARAIATLVTGWQIPPQWISNHDPYGLSLIAVLVIKETPFLIWIFASILNREDVSRNLGGQRAAALSLGHGIGSIWMRIFLPQILPKMIWPLVIVFVYSASVVDVALVIGPTQPPTLSNVVWADINDADVFNTARGAAGAWFLTLAIAAVAVIIWVLTRTILTKRSWLAAGPVRRDLIRPFGAPSPREKGGVKIFPSPLEKVPEGRMRSLAKLKFLALTFIYIIVALILLLLSIAPMWPFPNLFPEALDFKAWWRVTDNPTALLTSLTLAVSTSGTALVLILAWMESQPARRDRTVLVLSALALGLPALLLSLGQYRVFLNLNLTGSAIGLFLAHIIPVTAYMFIVLCGPYRSFDSRWRASASGLMVGYWRYMRQIKLPLLKAPLFAACAIGFAVSFGQYVPAQLIAAGRYSTLPMEAVTMTSGTNRPLTAAFALLLMVPPLVAFLAAAFFGKSRWSA